MNEYNLLNIIALIAVFVSILLTLFLLTVKSKNRLANILLAGFIIFSVVDISGVFIGPILKNKPEIYKLIKSFTLLAFPVFYFYVLVICYNNFKLKLKNLYHALPFVFYNLLLLAKLTFAKHDSLVFIIHKTAPYLMKIQGLLYLIAIIYVLRKYKRIYLENYAIGNLRIYKWLSHIVLLFLITLPATIIKDFSHFYNHQEVYIWTLMALIGSALIMFSWFILKALYTPEIFRGIDLEIKPVKTLTNNNVESKSIETLHTSNITIIEQLRKHMIEKEPFLDPNLTLQDLAAQMNIHARELSILINRHIGQHFFDFINKYRIEKAIEIIENSSIKEFTIQQILFDVGFNSKSSFNTEFKKHTGLTPTQYRNNHN